LWGPDVTSRRVVRGLLTGRYIKEVSRDEGEDASAVVFNRFIQRYARWVNLGRKLAGSGDVKRCGISEDVVVLGGSTAE
jgi:hypothetical protein